MVLLRATRRVLRSIVGPALGVPLATLASAAALSACEKSSGAGGPYTQPVGMVPMIHADAESAVPPGLLPVGSAAAPPPTLPVPGTAIPGTPPLRQPEPTPPGLSPSTVAAAATRPRRVASRATDPDDRPRFAAFAATRTLG
jgi:hypothetical protein